MASTLKLNDRELVLLANMLKRENMADFAISKLTPEPSTGAKRKSNKNEPIVNYIQNWARSMSKATSPQDKIQLAKEITDFLADRRGDPRSDEMRQYVSKILKRYFSANDISPAGYKRYVTALKRGTRVESKTYDAMSFVLESVGFSLLDAGFICNIYPEKNYVILEQIGGNKK